MHSSSCDSDRQPAGEARRGVQMAGAVECAKAKLGWKKKYYFVQSMKMSFRNAALVGFSNVAPSTFLICVCAIP